MKLSNPNAGFHMIGAFDINQIDLIDFFPDAFSHQQCLIAVGVGKNGRHFVATVTGSDV